MNKKLETIGYLFNMFPVEATDIRLDKFSLMSVLLGESIMKGIDAIIDVQDENVVQLNSNKYTATFPSSPPSIELFGDTTADYLKFEIDKIDMGGVTLSKDDLIKIKKNANIV